MSDSRRNFLKLSSWLLPLSATGRVFSKYQLSASKRPIVVSTWDSGTVANAAAWEVLSKQGKAIDAAEAAGVAIENEPSCCVGLGGNPDRDGRVTLDACIMDEKANIGSVAALERIKHPISVARKVMEDTPHVMLVGIGAQQFAIESGFTLESDALSESAAEAYREWLKKSEYRPVINVERQKARGRKGPFAPNFFEDGSFNHDTMGTIALDATGDLSGMCTTSGMGFKMRGRVGDSPIIGAGLFVDNEVGAVTCSGQGEEVIRIAGAHLVVEFMRGGLSPYNACRRAIERIVKRDEERAKAFQVGFIALSSQGEVGAYAVQPGFNYTVTDGESMGEIRDAESYF